MLGVNKEFELDFPLAGAPQQPPVCGGGGEGGAAVSGEGGEEGASAGGEGGGGAVAQGWTTHQVIKQFASQILMNYTLCKQIYTCFMHIFFLFEIFLMDQNSFHLL